MRGIITLFTLAGSLLFAKASAQTTTSITLGWTSSSSQDVAGYYIYYGTSSGNYISAVPVSATATNVTIRGLITGVTYYFAAASYDSSGNQSALSPEISGVPGSSQSAAATLTLTSAAASQPGQFGFAVSGLSSGLYIVQASTNLVNWVNLQTDSAPFNFVDSNASQFRHRFYRTAYVPSN